MTKNLDDQQLQVAHLASAESSCLSNGPSPTSIRARFWRRTGILRSWPNSAVRSFVAKTRGPWSRCLHARSSPSSSRCACPPFC
jgi:hypothetical protein